MTKATLLALLMICTSCFAMECEPTHDEHHNGDYIEVGEGFD